MKQITNAVYDYGSSIPIEIYYPKEAQMMLQKYQTEHPNSLVRLDDKNNIQIH